MRQEGKATGTAKRLALRISPSGERALRHGSPWLYDTWLENAPVGEAGDLAVAFGPDRKFRGIGLYDPFSAIRLRVLSHEPAVIDDTWFTTAIRTSAARRAPLEAPERDTNGYRLVNGENDGLPGLVIDRFANTAVLKLYTAAWIRHLPSLLAGLRELHPWERLVLRLNRSMQEHPEALDGHRDGEILEGPALEGPVLFHENGIVFEAEPVIGQKTGFFLDQRDNRARVGELSHGLDVLNVFSYTGGFSVYAARGGARSVTSVDLSVPATEAACRNFAHNLTDPHVAACHHIPLAEDAFTALERLHAQHRRFGLVILDPPMFAQSRAQVPAALAGYARLTRLGLSVLEPGGILVQASCSNRVPADDFFACVLQAVHETGRPLSEIARTGHAIDHPVTFENGAYLKCLFARS